MVPPTTTGATPKGTFAVGETMRPLNVPVAPGVTAAWLLPTPPTVTLFAGIVVAAKPCPSITMDDGDVPMKLNVVAPPTEL